MNVGSGGGAAAAPTAGGAAGGAAAAAEEKVEEKEEGKESNLCRRLVETLLMFLQRRKSQTRIWASDFSTKFFAHLSCLYFPMHGHGFLPHGANWLVE